CAVRQRGSPRREGASVPSAEPDNAHAVHLIYSRLRGAKNFLRLVYQTRQLTRCFGPRFTSKCGVETDEPRRPGPLEGGLRSSRDGTRKARARPVKFAAGCEF